MIDVRNPDRSSIDSVVVLFMYCFPQQEHERMFHLSCGSGASGGEHGSLYPEVENLAEIRFSGEQRCLAYTTLQLLLEVST